MAVILHIEASTEICSVALSEDGQVFFERVNEEERSHAKVIAPFVEYLKPVALMLSRTMAVSLVPWQAIHLSII